MAAPFPASFPASASAHQVGSYFVSQYYQILQQQPDLAHQFYTDASTMVRVGGNESDTATTMRQFHSLMMSLNFTEIEIKTIHSLASWNGGVLVMVSGSVQTKDFSGRRKFVQTFFLAPQEKGYFVLNDIFHFLDIEQTHQHHSATILAHGNFDTKLNATNPLPEPVSDYILEGETQSREFVEENDMVDKYSIPEAAPQVSEADNIVEEAPAEESSVSYPPVTNNVQDPQPFPVEGPAAEPQKHTYASILRVAKGPARPSVAHQASLGRTAHLAVSVVQHVPQPAPQQQYPASSAGPERSNAEAADEITTLEGETSGEGQSVYVRNLPSTVSAAAIEQEFKNFGRIRSEGIVIRNRKDIGVCYAFVEFEDALGVQNAIKASPIQFGGRQVHVEERRANSSSSQGGRRGRGGYQSEGARGRFGGRTFGRGGGLDGGEREYSINRQRGNGFHPRVPSQERRLLGNQNGPNPSQASA